jgi:hypothetical protein
VRTKRAIRIVDRQRGLKVPSADLSQQPYAASMRFIICACYGVS